MIDVLMPLIKQFLPFAQERMGFDAPPRLFLRGDLDNAKNPLGKTAFYDPAAKSITLYTTGRHPKDIMRSLSHELVHHKQNCDGHFNNTEEMGEGYAQNNEHMREMERQAYEMGNMCFRDWEDGIKSTIYFEHLQKGEKEMSTRDWKNRELNGLLMERFGFDFKPLVENLDENNGEVFAPNHYCVHHGGVHHNGKIEMAEAISHNYDEDLGRPTHYNMKLSDGTILENVAFEDIQVTEASLATEHDGHMAGNRDEEDLEEAIEEEELEERHKPENVSQGRDSGGRSTKKTSTGQKLRESDELKLREAIRNAIRNHLSL